MKKPGCVLQRIRVFVMQNEKLEFEAQCPVEFVGAAIRRPAVQQYLLCPTSGKYVT